MVMRRVVVAAFIIIPQVQLIQLKSYCEIEYRAILLFLR